MRRPLAFFVCPFLLGAHLFGGCSLPGFGHRADDSPARAFERLTDALEAEDWAAVYAAAASPGTQTLFDADFEKVKQQFVEKGADAMYAESVLRVSRDELLRMNARDFFIRMSEVSGRPGSLLVTIPDAESLPNGRVVETTIDGDEAWLTVRLEDGPRQMELFREDGRWYFQFLDVD